MNGMKGFIEVTDKNVGCKMLIPLIDIRSVFESDDGKAFIQMGINNRGESVGIYVQETYYSVVCALAAASCGDCISFCPNNEFKKIKGV